MSYVLVTDISASWEAYQALAGDVAGNLSAGLLLHIAGPTDEGFRIIEVWESEAAWRGHAVDRVVAPDPTDPVMQARMVVRALHPIHLVLSEAWVGRARHDWIAVGPGEDADRPMPDPVEEPVLGHTTGEV